MNGESAFVAVCVVFTATIYQGLALECFHCSEVTYNENPAETTQVRWRNDSRCGPDFTLSDGKTEAECDPDAGYPCCSKKGWCGASTLHCCSECLKYSRSFDDFDLPHCLRKTVSRCEDLEDVCVKIEISTNTTTVEIDRYQVIRKCGTSETDTCAKYTTAGHQCASYDCGKNTCNGASVDRAGWVLLVLVTIAASVIVLIC